MPETLRNLGTGWQRTEQMLLITGHQGKANQSHSEVPLHTTRAKIKVSQSHGDVSNWTSCEIYDSDTCE